MLKKLVHYIITFILVFLICLGTITAAALIPQKSIRENSKKSAEYYSNVKIFEQRLIENEDNTIIDNYADVILVNIIYCQDSSNPLKGSICLEYYSNDKSDVIESYDEVTHNDNIKTNRFYSRYWHGTMIVLKTLLMVTDIEGIRIINMIFIAILTIVLSVLLIKEKQIGLCISIIGGMLLMSVYVVPFCIEYVSSFVIMFLSSIACILTVKYKEKYLGTVFLVSGMLICFFDFLTCETLTFTVPALIVVILLFKNKRLTQFKEGILFIIQKGILWICGYGFMFMPKWAISSVFLKEKAFDEALTNATHRINSTVSNESGLRANRIFKNIVSMNIFNKTSTYGDLGLRLLIISAVIITILILYKKNKSCEKDLFKVIGIIMIIPYLRYMFLNNHSSVHYYFTYRAQLPVIAGAIYIIIKCIDMKLLKKDLNKIRHLVTK